MDKKKISIGISDFKTMIDNNCYYVDKSNLIGELIENGHVANLITRPRRFGKSLNMSMLKYFFENTTEDNRYLFNDLNISKSEKYMAYQGEYPVIYLSFTNMEKYTLEDNIKEFSRLIAIQYEKYKFDFNILNDREQKTWNNIINCKADIVELSNSIVFLCECLYKIYNRKVIILIDEYDVPLYNAYFKGFYNEMINFIRSLFKGALKDNPSLYMAVLTGCLRISKESIFTGMNNLVVTTILSSEYSNMYGFTEYEVKQMLEYYNLLDKFDTIKQWYDGYIYGGIEIYNAWSIVNYIFNLLKDKNALPEPYWSNSSSNSIIYKLITESTPSIKKDLETLISGKSIKKPLYDDMTYLDMETDKITIWSFLLHTGYLNLKQQYDFDDQRYGGFIIPNVEVLRVYKDKIRQWLNVVIQNTNHNELFKAMINDDVSSFEKYLNHWLIKTISYFDSKEKESFYHGLLLGLLSNFDGYMVVSNRESGHGRFDIVVKDFQYNKAIILELKISNTKKELSKMCDVALQQIETEQYQTDLIKEGYENISKYGIAFFNKLCMVKLID